MLSLVRRTRSNLLATFATLFALTGAAPAFAVGPDFSAISTAVDFGTAAAGIIGIFALIAVLYVAWKGGHMVVSAIRG